MSFINQGETDRENDAVGRDDEPLPPYDQAIADGDFEAALEELEKLERERVKRECHRELLMLGLVPQSFVSQRGVRP